MALVEVDSPTACYFCDSAERLQWNPDAWVAWLIKGHAAVSEVIRLCFVVCTRPLGSLTRSHNLSFGVRGWEGDLVVGCRSQCCRMSVKMPAGWKQEGRSESQRLHRQGWRCADLPAIARDSGRRTFCVAEANAGSQRSGEAVCRRGAERASVMPEHGAFACGERVYT